MYMYIYIHRYMYVCIYHIYMHARGWAGRGRWCVMASQACVPYRHAIILVYQCIIIVYITYNVIGLYLFMATPLALAFTIYCFTSSRLCTSRSFYHSSGPPALPTLVQYYCTAIGQYTTRPRPFFGIPYTIQY